MRREYSHLLHDDPTAERGVRFAAGGGDVTELLAERGPVRGAPLDRRVAYDPPCHLLHAQRVAAAPLAVLQAIPILQLVARPDAAQCCGAAGLYTLVQPDMSAAVLPPHLTPLATPAPQPAAPGTPAWRVQPV